MLPASEFITDGTSFRDSPWLVAFEKVETDPPIQTLFNLETDSRPHVTNT
jgi:hypothetical protein